MAENDSCTCVLALRSCKTAAKKSGDGQAEGPASGERRSRGGLSAQSPTLRATSPSPSPPASVATSRTFTSRPNCPGTSRHRPGHPKRGSSPMSTHCGPLADSLLVPRRCVLNSVINVIHNSCRGELSADCIQARNIPPGSLARSNAVTCGPLFSRAACAHLDARQTSAQPIATPETDHAIPSPFATAADESVGSNIHATSAATDIRPCNACTGSFDLSLQQRTSTHRSSGRTRLMVIYPTRAPQRCLSEALSSPIPQAPDLQSPQQGNPGQKQRTRRELYRCDSVSAAASSERSSRTRQQPLPDRLSQLASAQFASSPSEPNLAQFSTVYARSLSAPFSLPCAACAFHTPLRAHRYCPEPSHQFIHSSQRPVHSPFTPSIIILLYCPLASKCPLTRSTPSPSL